MRGIIPKNFIQIGQAVFKIICREFKNKLSEKNAKKDKIGIKNVTKTTVTQKISYKNAYY